MIGKAIYSQLTGTVAVSTLIGTRVDPQFNPKTVRPSVVYKQERIERDRVYDGSVTGIAHIGTTITALADTYIGAVALAAEIVTAIDHKSGTWGTIVVLGCFVEDEDEEVSMLDSGTDKPIYAKSLTANFIVRT